MKSGGNCFAIRPSLWLCPVFVLLWAWGIDNFAAKRVINVGIYDNPPKIYLDQKGRPAGFFVDLLNHMATIEDWQINYHFFTWKECLEQLEKGNLDLLPDVAYSPERNDRFYFNTIEVLESWSQIYVRDKIKIQHLRDLSGKRVAVLKGSVQQNSFHQIMTGFGYPYKEVPADSLAEVLNMVHIELADAGITNVLFGNLNARDHDLNKTDLIFNPVTLYFAGRPNGDSALIKTIDLYLDTWKKTPQSFYYKTLQQYTPAIPNNGTHPLTFVFLAIILSTIILFTTILFLKQRQLSRLSCKFNLHQQLLHAEKNKSHSFFDHSPIGMFVSDAKGRYTEVNSAACEITGYQARELTEMSIADLIPESGRKAASRHFNQLKSQGHADGNMPFITKAGKIRHWRVSAAQIEEEKFVGFVQDITDRVKTEE